MLCSVRGAVLPVEDTTDRLSTRLAMGATLGSPAEEPMKPARSRLAVATSCFSIALLAASAVAQAGNLFTASSSGPLFAFGGSGVLVFAWSQNTVYFNVDITATLADTTPGGPIPGTQGVVYLTTSFGPGTTPANNAAPPVTVSGLKGFFEPRRLFSGLGLNAGTYYLVWAPTNHTPHLSMSPAAAMPNAVTMGPGVSFVGNGNSDTVDPFPPATNTPVSESGIGSSSFIITITGDPPDLAGVPTPPTAPTPTAVPTLSAWGTLALAGLLVLLTMLSWSRRRRTRA